jgi:hypothetical protein
VLSGGAKALIGLLLVLGVATVIVNVVVDKNILHSSRESNAAAALRVEDSYSKLNTALQSFQSRTSACNGSLTCVTAQDTKAAQAFGAFAQAMRGISMSAGAPTTAANEVISDATAGRGDLTKLAASTSISQYQQTVASTGLEQQLNQFDTDYQKLGKALGVG